MTYPFRFTWVSPQQKAAPLSGRRFSNHKTHLFAPPLYHDKGLITPENLDCYAGADRRVRLYFTGFYRKNMGWFGNV
jgi:hypothetical protein